MAREEPVRDFRALFHLDPDYCDPDHDPDFVTLSGGSLHREDNGVDHVMTTELNKTLLMGKNRASSLVLSKYLNTPVRAVAQHRGQNGKKTSQ